MQSTEDGDPHRGPYDRWHGRLRAGDKGVDTRSVGEVGGSLWCTSGFGSSPSSSGGIAPSSTTSRTGSRHDETARQRRCLAGGKKVVRVIGGHFIGVPNGEEVDRLPIKCAMKPLVSNL
jgi:hypothetical protein